MNKISLFVIDTFVYCLIVGILLAYHYDTIKLDLLKISYYDALLICLSAIIFGVSADLLYLYILKDHHNPFVLPIVYCGPIFTLFISFFVMKDKMKDIYGILGALLIMTGIFCISLRK